jgi:predicted nucleic acid-binding protein
MIVLADTNIIVSFFLNSSNIQKIITDESNQLQIFAVDFAFKELIHHKEKIIETSGIERRFFNRILNAFKERVHTTIETSKLSKKDIQLAKNLIGHIDLDDVLIVAAALSVPCHLWTSDKKLLLELRKTNTLKTITTSELMQKIYRK